MRKCIIIALLLSVILSGCSFHEGHPNNFYSLKDYQELIEFVQKEAISPSEIPYITEAVYQERYNALIADYAENGIFIPYIGDTPAFSIGKDCQHAATVFQYESFNKPWIWYFTEINGAYTRIQVMKLDDVFAEMEDDASFFNLGKAIIGKRATKKKVINSMLGGSCKKRGEGTAELYDKTVSTVYGQSNNGRYYLAFAYNDHLIRIVSENPIPTDWLKMLHFQRDRK